MDTCSELLKRSIFGIYFFNPDPGRTQKWYALVKGHLDFGDEHIVTVQLPSGSIESETTIHRLDLVWRLKKQFEEMKCTHMKSEEVYPEGPEIRGTHKHVHPNSGDVYHLITQLRNYPKATEDGSIEMRELVDGEQKIVLANMMDIELLQEQLPEEHQEGFMRAFLRKAGLDPQFKQHNSKLLGIYTAVLMRRSIGR